MSTQALFIQGAGQGAHAADEKLVASLGQLLGPEFDIHYPVMPHEDDADYEIWRVQIASELAAMHDPVLLLGHSVGASMLLKYLSEITPMPSTPLKAGQLWQWVQFLWSNCHRARHWD